MSKQNRSSRYIEYLQQQGELDDPTIQETSSQPELYHHDQSQQTKDSDTFIVNVHDQEMAIDLPWNMTVDRQEQQPQQSQTMTHTVLSPTKIDQGLTSTTSDNMACSIEEIQTDIEKIPDFLTKYNQSFQQMLKQVQSTLITTATTNNTSNEEGLRKVALLIYKILIINNYHRLWTIYLKSGQGELIIPSTEVSKVFYATTIPIWPKQIKTFVSSKTNITKKNENEIYFTFVNQQLNELNHRLKNYQDQLHMETNRFPAYRLDVQKIIETYIEQNLHLFHMKIEHEIELTRFDYHIRVLKLEYLRHNPNQYQEQLMKEVCQSKYEQETTEQEYHFLQQQINYYSNSPDQSFESSPLGQSTTERLTNLVENVDMRQQLFQQFKAVAQQSRNDIFQVNMKLAEEQRKEYRKKFEDNIKKMWSAHRRPIDWNQTISQVMIQLIIQRCEKISERIQCIYKFKANKFLL